MKNTTRNTKTSRLTVTRLNKIERIRRIVTAIKVVPKEAWVPFGFNCWQSSLPSSEEIFITGNSSCSTLWKSKSLLSHWLPATQILRLSNLIHILLFKLLSILHVHSWHSDCHCVYEVHALYMSWQFPLFFFEFSDQSHCENTQCYFSVGLPQTVCAFVSLILDNIRQQYVPRNTVAKFYPKCFLLLLWKISDQMISLDYYHPWSATNSARSFTFQPVSFGQWNVVS